MNKTFMQADISKLNDVLPVEDSKWICFNECVGAELLRIGTIKQQKHSFKPSIDEFQVIQVSPYMVKLINSSNDKHLTYIVSTNIFLKNFKPALQTLKE